MSFTQNLSIVTDPKTSKNFSFSCDDGTRSTGNGREDGRISDKLRSRVNWVCVTDVITKIVVDPSTTQRTFSVSEVLSVDRCLILCPRKLILECYSEKRDINSSGNMPFEVKVLYGRNQSIADYLTSFPYFWMSLVDSFYF